MQTTEPKNAFLLLRANGWSLRSISQELGIPKSTLFNWESDPPTRRAINVLKSLQLEKLQERYIPSFEEELQKLSTLLGRVESALAVQDLYAMRPEFLLRTSLQLRSRLNKLRSDISPTHTLNDGEVPEMPLPGCISRSQTVAETDDDFSSPSPPQEQRAGLPAKGSATAGEPACANGATRDKTENLSEPYPSATTTSTTENGTPVPSPQLAPSEPSRENLQPILSPPDHGRNGNIVTPPPAIPTPVTADQLALTAGFHPSR